MKNLELKNKFKDGILIAIPLGLLAIFQMFLNYIRFDNIFEFGAKYQLTSFNMISCMSISFGKSLAGFIEYIFRIPKINPMEFPFVFINTETSLVSINEVCYENRLFGLIAIPILWVYFFKKNVLKDDESGLKAYTNLSIVTVIIAIIINTCFGGICEAYSIDFKLILCINAILLFLKMIEKNNSNEINKLFLLISITTIIIMFPISLTTESNFLIDLKRPITVYLKSIFEFWA